MKTKAQLDVPLPQPNGDFNSLARALSKDLPRVSKAPTGGAARRKWQQKQRARLRDVVKAKDYAVQQATIVGREQKAELQANDWRLRVGGAWTLPATELARGRPQGVTLLVADAGRRGATNQVEPLLAAGQRVVAVDPFSFGESKPAQRDHLWALLVCAVGDRPLGLQASQIAAVARWLRAEHPGEPVTLCARVELHDAFPSLKSVIEQNHSFEEMPELFCFGLLEAFDLEQLKALATARLVAESK
jgi:hypothetical protein